MSEIVAGPHNSVTVWLESQKDHPGLAGVSTSTTSPFIVAGQWPTHSSLGATMSPTATSFGPTASGKSLPSHRGELYWDAILQSWVAHTPTSYPSTRLHETKSGGSMTNGPRTTVLSPVEAVSQTVVATTTSPTVTATIPPESAASANTGEHSSTAAVVSSIAAACAAAAVAASPVQIHTLSQAPTRSTATITATATSTAAAPSSTLAPESKTVTAATKSAATSQTGSHNGGIATCATPATAAAAAAAAATPSPGPAYASSSTGGSLAGSPPARSRGAGAAVPIRLSAVMAAAGAGGWHKATRQGSGSVRQASGSKQVLSAQPPVSHTHAKLVHASSAMQRQTSQPQPRTQPYTQPQPQPPEQHQPQQASPAQTARLGSIHSAQSLHSTLSATSGAHPESRAGSHAPAAGPAETAAPPSSPEEHQHQHQEQQNQEQEQDQEEGPSELPSVAVMELPSQLPPEALVAAAPPMAMVISGPCECQGSTNSSSMRQAMSTGRTMTTITSDGTTGSLQPPAQPQLSRRIVPAVQWSAKASFGTSLAPSLPVGAAYFATAPASRASLGTGSNSSNTSNHNKDSHHHSHTSNNHNTHNNTNHSHRVANGTGPSTSEDRGPALVAVAAAAAAASSPVPSAGSSRSGRTGAPRTRATVGGFRTPGLGAGNSVGSGSTRPQAFRPPTRGLSGGGGGGRVSPLAGRGAGSRDASPAASRSRDNSPSQPHPGNTHGQQPRARSSLSPNNRVPRTLSSPSMGTRGGHEGTAVSSRTGSKESVANGNNRSRIPSPPALGPGSAVTYLRNGRPEHSRSTLPATSPSRRRTGFLSSLANSYQNQNQNQSTPQQHQQQRSSSHGPAETRKKPGDDKAGHNQMAQLWKRLEEVQQEAQRKIELVQYEAAALRQDNQRLQRRVDELECARQESSTLGSPPLVLVSNTVERAGSDGRSRSEGATSREATCVSGNGASTTVEGGSSQAPAPLAQRQIVTPPVSANGFGPPPVSN
mmetsp:Transcript_21313/g.45564  ORF Transcript_21313/g.45564 Transcript_21313/m.45564 type:complete len:993 (-) Transcript_21313:276-3254(-)